MDPTLRRAYENTSYRVFLEQGVAVIRVGTPTPELDAILLARNSTSWVFVTAWNPGSRPTPREANERQQEKLLQRIATMGNTWLGGEGVGNDGNWDPEPSFLVLDLDRAAAQELGREFGQRAVVVGSIGTLARLLECD